MIIATAPLIAHFIALTDTKITNWAFIAITFVVFVMAFLNIIQLI